MLELTDVTKVFPQPGGGSLTVLDVPSMKIAAGEQIALLGTSGGGKTTLLHVIAGLSTPTAGSIKFDNIELTRLSEAGRDRYRAASIGYIFQTFNLMPPLTAIENVRLGMAFSPRRGESRRAAELLAGVGLADRANYKPAQLSVGQQQRVSIARALAGRPKLLLADEPTANVDPATGATVLDMIFDFCRRDNIALLCVTHDHGVADRFDKIWRLEDLNRAFQPTPDTRLDKQPPSSGGPQSSGEA